MPEFPHLNFAGIDVNIGVLPLLTIIPYLLSGNLPLPQQDVEEAVRCKVKPCDSNCRDVWNYPAFLLSRFLLKNPNLTLKSKSSSLVAFSRNRRKSALSKSVLLFDFPVIIQLYELLPIVF
jgi:hypothetical protein